MRLDPSLSVEEWRQLLRQEALRTWGEERAQALAELLDRTAMALGRVANYPLASEEEPFLLGAEPFPSEEG
ncbi:MAG: hypothetical protein ACE5IZ_06715 [Dehalococcoidia bacterium]